MREATASQVSAVMGDTLEVAVDSAQQAWLLEAAQACPVSRALGVQIRTRTAESETASDSPANYRDDLAGLPIPHVDPDQRTRTL